MLSLQRGEVESAVAQLQRAVAQAPRMVAAHIYLGNALFTIRRYPEALDSYERALAIEGRSFDALYGCGCVYQATGRAADAEGFYRRALSLRPGHPAVQVNLGTALQQQGKIDQAVASFRKAVTVAPRLAEAYVALGHALLIKREYGQALESFTQATKLGLTSADLHLGMGEVLHAKGDIEAALDHYQRACDLAPRSQNAYLKLDRLLLNAGGPEKRALLEGLLTDHVYEEWEEAVDQGRALAALYRYPDGQALAELRSFFDELRPERVRERAWWQGRLARFGPLEKGHDKLLRGVFSAVFSWSIPTREELQAIADFVVGGRLYSYGAGTGYWEALLRNHYGVEVVASDCLLRNRFMEMVREDYGEAKVVPTDVIFLSWICGGDRAVNRLLEQMVPGQRLVLIGEPPDPMGIPRICATPEMFALLERDFRRVARYPLVSYSLLNDVMELYERR